MLTCTTWRDKPALFKRCSIPGSPHTLHSPLRLAPAPSASCATSSSTRHTRSAMRSQIGRGARGSCIAHGRSGWVREAGGNSTAGQQHSWEQHSRAAAQPGAVWGAQSTWPTGLCSQGSSLWSQRCGRPQQQAHAACGQGPQRHTRTLRAVGPSHLVVQPRCGSHAAAHHKAQLPPVRLGVRAQQGGASGGQAAAQLQRWGGGAAGCGCEC